MSCSICSTPIKIRKNSPRINKTICKNCYCDKIYSLFEAETRIYDIGTLNKMYFGHYVVFLKEEVDKIESCENLGLNNYEILSLKWCETADEAEERLKNIMDLEKSMDLSNEVYNDKYVQVYVDKSMIPYESEKEFYEYLIDKYEN